MSFTLPTCLCKCVFEALKISFLKLEVILGISSKTFIFSSLSALVLTWIRPDNKDSDFLPEKVNIRHVILGPY